MDARPMFVEKEIKVHAYDIDVMGIVSNIVCIRWFEDLRFLLLETYWPYGDMLKIGQSPILNKTDLTRSRWTVSLEIRAEGTLMCKGSQTGYFYDMEQKRPVPIPQQLHSIYQSHIEREVQ
ncbi:MAG: acyl-CoA thioesterase [Oscillospiraceae bacterium]